MPLNLRGEVVASFEREPPKAAVVPMDTSELRSLEREISDPCKFRTKYSDYFDLGPPYVFNLLVSASLKYQLTCLSVRMSDCGRCTSGCSCVTIPFSLVNCPSLTHVVGIPFV